MGFITTILIVLLVYYAIKILLKILAPKILNYAGRKAEKHFREKFEGFGTPQQAKTTQDGDVIIKTNTSKHPKASKKVGEYIDFEEID